MFLYWQKIKYIIKILRRERSWRFVNCIESPEVARNVSNVSS